MSLDNLNELPDVWKKRLEYIDDITDQETLIHLALSDGNIVISRLKQGVVLMIRKFWRGACLKFQGLGSKI